MNIENCIHLEGEIYSSKNSRQFFKNKYTGKTYLSKSKRAKEQESDLFSKLNTAQNINKWMKMGKNKEFPLKVGFYIVRKTHRRWDWQNIIQGVADALVKAGYLPDDSAVYFTPVYLGWEVNKEKPSVTITII